MKRLAIFLGCVAGVANADSRKTAPNAYTKAARDAFAKAVAAEDAGDLDEARRQYERAFAIAPHPATLYNLAGVNDRQGMWDVALELYEQYLLLAPAAPDRSDVEKLIAARLKQKTTLTLTDNGSNLQLETAYIFVDGVAVVKPGEAKVERRDYESRTTISIMPGVHAIDVVTPVSFASVREDVKLRARPSSVDLRGPAAVEGNVVVSVAGLTNPEQPYNTLSVRMKPGPGRFVLNVQEEGNYCKPVTVDVPKTVKDVLYVYAAPTEVRLDRDAPPRCRNYKLEQQMLVFPH